MTWAGRAGLRPLRACAAQRPRTGDRHAPTPPGSPTTPVPWRCTDVVGTEAAVTAWRRHLLQHGKISIPRTVNQTLAAVTLLYALGKIRQRSVIRA